MSSTIVWTLFLLHTIWFWEVAWWCSGCCADLWWTGCEFDSRPCTARL